MKPVHIRRSGKVKADVEAVVEDWSDEEGAGGEATSLRSLRHSDVAPVDFGSEEGDADTAKNYSELLKIPDLLKTTDRRLVWANEDHVREGMVKEELEKVPGAFVVRSVLTPEECVQFIEMSEEMGFAPAPLRVLNGKENDSASMDKTIRDSERVLYHAPDELTNVLNARLLQHMPKEIVIEKAWAGTRTFWSVKPECVNERLRFNRYELGQYFKPHFDAGFARCETEKSLLTLIVYLNGGIDGGETTFFPEGKPYFHSEPNTVEEFAVRPEAGKVLVFYHNGPLSPRHEGTPHRTEGAYKYIIRSDVMYVVDHVDTVEPQDVQDESSSSSGRCMLS